MCRKYWQQVSVSLIFLSLFALPESIYPVIKDKPEVVSLFAQGEQFMAEQRWSDAVNTFQQLSEEFHKSKNIDLFQFNLGKALLYSGNLTDARSTFREFLSRFDNSRLRAHAFYFSALAAQQSGELARAFEFVLMAYSQSEDSRLDSLIEYRLSLPYFSTLSASPEIVYNLNRTKQCRLFEIMGEQPFKHHRQLYQHMMNTCTQKRKEKPRGASELSLVAILPFTGELQSFGEEIYSGAVVAAELYSAERRVPVTLVPYDSRGNPAEAGRLAKLLKESDIDAIVGPLTSEEVAVAAAAIGEDSLPLVAPVAGGNGLTELGAGIFQLIPDLDVQASTMARYAIHTLGARTAAIITSNIEEHQRLADAFKESFQLNGGIVVAEQYYRARDKDFSTYLRDLKRTVRGAPDTSASFINEKGDTLEWNTVPANVDCLYMPGTPVQLKQLLPQINFFNIKGALLGSESWNEEGVLSLAQSVTKGAVFPSTSGNLPSGNEYMQFAIQYEGRFGKQPELLAYRGYEAVALLCRAALSGAERTTVLNALLHDSSPDLLADNIHFTSSRVRSDLPLYRIEKGTAIPLNNRMPTPYGGEDSENND